MKRAIPPPTSRQCQLTADVGNLDHAGMSYLLGGLLASRFGEPDNSPFWTFIAKLLDLVVTGPPEWATLLKAAHHALRSYEHGNASTELAKELADSIEKSSAWSVVSALKPKPPATAELKGKS